MRGRPILGFVAGAFLGLFVWLDLWLGGIVPSNNNLLLPLIIIGAVGGIALAWWAPFGRKRLTPAQPPAAGGGEG